MPASDVRLIECEGSHADMGRSQGEQCAVAVADLDRAMTELIGVQGTGMVGRAAALAAPAVSALAGRVSARLLGGALKSNYPDQYARTVGIAEGAGVPTNRVFVAPAAELILGRAVYTRPRGACTAVAVDRGRSDNGEPILGKNFDYRTAALDQYVARISRPEGLAASIDVTMAPLCGSHEGINEYGLAIAYNYGHFRGKAAARVAITTLVQELLEQCDSVEDAIAHMERRPRAGSAILMLADGGGNIASVELGPDSMAVRFGVDEGGYLAHTNHALTGEMRARDVPHDAHIPKWFPAQIAGKRYHGSSMRRHERAMAMADGREYIDDGRVKEILSDHNGGAGDDESICRHGEHYATTASVLLYPRRRSVELMFGSPCTAKYVTITLDGGIRIAETGDDMKKFTGTVGKNDLEGGFWELAADDGERYQLRGGDDGLRVAGQRVVIEGTVDGGGFGIGMTGPYLDVSSWSAA